MAKSLMKYKTAHNKCPLRKLGVNPILQPNIGRDVCLRCKLKKCVYEGNEKDVAVSCPLCKTVETLYFVNGRLEDTRMYKRKDRKIYHICGAECKVVKF